MNRCFVCGLGDAIHLPLARVFTYPIALFDQLHGHGLCVRDLFHHHTLQEGINLEIEQAGAFREEFLTNRSQQTLRQ